MAERVGCVTSPFIPSPITETIRVTTTVVTIIAVMTGGPKVQGAPITLPDQTILGQSGRTISAGLARIIPARHLLHRPRSNPGPNSLGLRHARRPVVSGPLTRPDYVLTRAAGAKAGARRTDIRQALVP